MAYCEIIMEQTTEASGMQSHPGKVFKLVRSTYGVKQAGRIWDTFLFDYMNRWGYFTAASDPRVLITCVGEAFVHVVIVVNDMLFSSNSRRMLDGLKER